MPGWLVLAIVALVFSVVATWVVRRLLDVGVGWLRAWVTAVVVFALALPVAAWSLGNAGVYQDGRFVASTFIAIAFVALTAGWMLAAVVIAVQSLEFLWPSRRWRKPIAVARDALRQRDRARRYAQILTIGSRHGLTFYESRRHGEGEEDDLPTALVAAMNEAGVTFIKLGQVLSSREDVLPPAFIEAFSTLQMDSSPIPWSEAEAAIAAELRRPIADVFAEIDPAPLAAASVAQVHAARLVSGEEVVVKIQRPQARAQVTTDLDILERLANEAEKRTEWAKAYGARALVAEFSRVLRDELDYRVEVANTEMLRGAIAASGATTRLHLPAVHKEYSTARMIVQERIHGTPFGKLQPGAVLPAQAKHVADALLQAVFDQIGVRGVFHADLHAGNVFLGEDGNVTLLDFGSVGVIERSMRRLLVPLLIGVANEDDIAVTDAVLLICGPPAGGSGSTHFNTVTLQRDIGMILTRVHNSRADENLFRLLVDVLRRNRMAVPPSLLLVFRTLVSLEGTLRRLVPDYDMVARSLEIAPRMALSLITPRGAMLTAETWSALLSEQARRLPRRLESLTRSLDEGKLEFRLRAFESRNERTWVDGIMGRVTTTAVGITLVIAGIMLVIANGGPMVTGDVSAFSFLGAVVGLGGLLLLMRSLRTALRRR